MINVIIPARGGSKQLKKKNIQQINGLNLIEISIIQAKLIFEENCKIYVSTESEEIKNSIKINHIDYKIIDRPEILASDTAKTIDVLKHGTETINTFSYYTALFQPTNIFRDIQKIKSQLPDFFKGNYDSSLSGSWNHSFFWENDRRIFTDSRIMRQEKKHKIFEEDGCFYLFNKDFIYYDDWIFNKIYYIENISCQVDIHSQNDLDLARLIFPGEICLKK